MTVSATSASVSPPLCGNRFDEPRMPGPVLPWSVTSSVFQVPETVASSAKVSLGAFQPRKMHWGTLKCTAFASSEAALQAAASGARNCTCGEVPYKHGHLAGPTRCRLYKFTTTTTTSNVANTPITISSSAPDGQIRHGVPGFWPGAPDYVISSSSVRSPLSIPNSKLAPRQSRQRRKKPDLHTWVIVSAS